MTQINETRANPLQRNQTTAAPGMEPAPAVREPTTIIRCRDCRHWNRTWPKANHAQCIKAMAYGSAPLMTTDLQTCSQAEPR